jgi:hypothetical protein
VRVISFLFGRGRTDGADPWVQESIFQLIRTNVDSSTGRLCLRDLELPDERRAQGDSKIRWAAGAADGVATHHMGSSKQEATAKRAAMLIEEIAQSGAMRPQKALYSLLRDESALDLVDEVLRILTARQIPIEPHLSRLAVRLATESADRAPVKFGLALLGILQLREHVDTAITLGTHDEFTLFAAVALKNMLDDSSSALWNLARRVDGWGRIQVVERLVPTDNAEIQRWLRTEGFRNSIMYEYLSHTAAVHGRLREGLEAPNVSEADLMAASEIIRALISGNGAPAEGIDAYDDAAEVCRLYLEHVPRHPRAIGHFLTMRAILDYVRDDKRDPSTRLKNGWSETSVEDVEQTAAALSAHDLWLPLIQSGLRSEDEAEFHDASRSAQYLDLDTFDFHWARLIRNTKDGGRWSYVMQRANADRIDQIVELAEQHIPLDDIATGPANEWGLGPEFANHNCLDFILQDLAQYPGKGWKLIASGLQSPVVRNRNMALNALSGWGKGAWPAAAEAALERALAKEPDDDIKQRIRDLLKA